MDRKSLTTLFWIAFAVSIVVFLMNPKTLENYFYGLLICLVYSFFFGISNGFVNKFLSQKYSWTEETTKRTILGIVVTVIVNVIVCYLCGYINFVVIQKTATAEEFFSDKYAFTNWFTINIALLASAFLHAKSFMEEWKRASRKEVVEQKLIAKSANAQFESLKNQLDPHFLFNSLNVLSSLIDENPNQAQRFTASMSKIYRYVLEQKDKELVTVEEEIEFAKIYCDLLKTRFEDSVNFEFRVKDTDLKSFVVPLSLQLLLENCIKHNFATSSKPLNITIYSENGYLFIENNLQEREQVKDSAGIGLSNIVQRYSLLTKTNVFIEKSNEFFRVKIPMLNQKTTTMNIQPSRESLAYIKASKRVKELKGFYGNVTSYCLVIPFLIFVNLYTAPNYHWFWWPMFGWGIGVASHALQVFGIGKNWEENQIRKIMEKDEFKN